MLYFKLNKFNIFIYLLFNLLPLQWGPHAPMTRKERRKEEGNEMGRGTEGETPHPSPGK